MGLFSFLKKKKTASGDACVYGSSLEPDEVIGGINEAASLDLTEFWHGTKESDRRHTSAPFTDEILQSVESELGYKLPESFIALMRERNGGLVNKCRYRVPSPIEGCPDTVYITEIMGIGRDVPYSLCGRFGSEFLIDSRRHRKDIGVAICNTTLPGRALVFLDYRACGKTGEPCVTWADAMNGTEIRLARSFAEFLRGLEVNTVER